MTDFYNQGAVPLRSAAYIEREFEQRVFEELNARRWVLLLGPRQHGKSSGLVRLNARLRESGYAAAIVDLQALPPCERFPDLLRWVADQVGKNIQRNVPRPRDDLQGEFAAWLEAVLPSGTSPFVIIIDEAGSIENAQYRNSFYGQIRHISSERAYATPDALPSRILFVFSGTFRPETLVHEQNSPFNVCELILTDDVTVDNVSAFVNAVNPAVAELVPKAHAHVNGQPYLLQTVFQETLRRSELPLEQAFAEALSSLTHKTGPHLEGIFSKVVGNTGLVQKVAQMVQQGSTSFTPADSDCSFLEVLGLAKRKESKLVFRNSLYELVAKESPQLQPAAPTTPPQPRSQVFPIDKSDLAFMKNADLREVCFSAYDGGAKAHGNGNYRLALTGFGSAMEALLLDFLIGLPPTDLQTAIAASLAESDRSKKANFNNFEPQNDPKKWRLVNLINVAKKAKSGKTYPEPSHALREWRNLVHPAEAIQHFVDESKLKPESVLASALFSVLLRDLNP